MDTLPMRWRDRNWAIASAVWCVAFALPHMLWGLGLFQQSLRWSLGVLPKAEEERMIHSAGFAATGLWGVAALLIIAACIALSTVQSWGQRFPRWMRIVGPAGVALILTVRGLLMPGLILGIAYEFDWITIPDSIDPVWNRWSIVLWSPWFLVGAGLFACTARTSFRSTKAD